ncbi:MAG TPA: universal stress protein [Membranihabitans sp.]|nr:universal stress protein [Membranihabitans sp.]
MKKYSHILVALDLSSIDRTLIRNSAVLADVMQVEKIYFVHNIKKYEISSLFSDDMKDVDLDEIVGEELNEKVSEYFYGDTPWEVFISEDPYTESLIHYVVNKFGISLTLVGNKNRSGGTGLLTSKLLRMLRCDILAIPRDIELTFESVWAGTDFSNPSKKIFPLLEFLYRQCDTKVTAVHVYEVPLHFSPYVPKEEMHPKIERHTEKRFSRFIKSIHFPGPLHQQIIPGRDTGLASLLVKSAEKDKADLLVIADKGGNTFSSLVIGSTAEEVFNHILSIPLWVVK